MGPSGPDRPGNVFKARLAETRDRNLPAGKGVGRGKHNLQMHRSSLFTLPVLAGMALFISPIDSHAQAFEEGVNTASVGYGFVTLLGSVNNTFDSYSDVNYSSTGPLYAKFEHAISDKVGLGLNFAYAGNQWAYQFNDGYDGTNYTETSKRTTFSVLARMNFHFGSSDKFDPYAGFGLGYRSANWTIDTDDPNGGSGVDFKTLVPLGMEITVGARYYFMEHLGAYVEVGAAKSVVQVGLVGKF
jgi:opacity protein-like surface antigen